MSTPQDTGTHLIKTQRSQLIWFSLSLHLASVSNSKDPISTTHLNIESVPPRIAEGESVLLLVHNLPKNLMSLFWYKGVIAEKKFELTQHIIATSSSMPGPAHSGRETVYSNGSLLLHKFTQNDTGFYTLRTMSTDLTDEVAHVQLQLDSKWISVIVQCRVGLRHTGLSCLYCAFFPRCTVSPCWGLKT